MDRLHHYLDTLGSLFHRQAPDIVCTELKAEDGTLSSFTVNSDMEVTRADIAARIGTTAGELDELRHHGVFVLFCKSSQFNTTNGKACELLGKPGQVRGPAYMVRHTSPTLSVFESCAPVDVVCAFPNIFATTMDKEVVVETVVTPPPPPPPSTPQTVPEEEKEKEIRVVIAQAVEKFKNDNTEQQRIVIDDDDEENPLAGKRGLPVRRGKTAKTLRRNRKREKEDQERDEPPVRRSSRLLNKRR